ncbi:EI24 domain-containing protein [Denitratisoma oestradiolicum]|uniref:EI24 domain-containing protein n=1 Tax=Denitratisoma oestradiolicum TaxID=311182 RepID=A0A6S6YBC8_9PROT|nr:EI24 domain-containing protein [Denitratisoma oestradiolicum]TWO79082.1 hypothetical protein CBW56_16550 [Denitratisoma oestradiolicum]CAB1369926.1 conserved membrane protein of unknown function [Denitratisoma oestradiolicum]
MDEVLLALVRSLHSLTRPRIWGYLLTPALLALVVGGGLSPWLYPWFRDALLDLPPLSWLLSWDWPGLAGFLATLGSALSLLALAYLLATLLAGIVVVPWLIAAVARDDYRELAPMGRDSLLASLVNGLAAALGFTLGWLLTLPLWLVPGLALVLPVYWVAWLNRRTFAPDCLALHATAHEARNLRRDHAQRLLILGAVPALLAPVPLAGLLAPALAALLFTHYTLEALRRLRGGAVVSQ